MELGRLQKLKTEFDEEKIRIYAVAVDVPEELNRVRKKIKASFSFLSDKEGQLLDIFDVRHVDASPYGGDIARSSSFLLDRTGKVVWSHATPNYRVRKKPEQILAEIRALGN